MSTTNKILHQKKINYLSSTCQREETRRALWRVRDDSLLLDWVVVLHHYQRYVHSRNQSNVQSANYQIHLVERVHSLDGAHHDKYSCHEDTERKKKRKEKIVSKVYISVFKNKEQEIKSIGFF